MSDVLDRKEFVAGYLVEAEEHLRASTAHLLAIEATLGKNEPQPRRVRELFRALHTLKGLSAMVGVEPIVEISHEMEAILRLADRSAGQLSFGAVELLLKGVRAIELRVSAFAAGSPVAAVPSELLDALSSLQPTSSDVPERRAARINLDPQLLGKLSPAEQLQLAQGAQQGRRAIRIDYFPSPARSADSVSITSVRERVGKLAEIVKVIPMSMPKTEQAPGALAFILLVLSDASPELLAAAAYMRPEELRVIEIEAEPEQAPGLSELPGEEEGLADSPLRTDSIRVDVARLDDAMEKLSELVVTRFRLSRAVAALRDKGVDVRELTSIVNENSRQLRDLRACITRARMVPVRELLDRVPLIVRGMNRSTGKQVRLVIETGNAELDKSVAERLFPAVVHLVRNAIDHAIESPEERRTRGKPEQGLVTVSCFEHSNNELELRVADDGRGMDVTRIARKAGREVPRNEKELLELITLPGFSTVDQPTSSSGRGMGMEIVKRIAVNSLGGSLSLQTALDQGTTFTLRVPLSISIVDSFAFMCGEEAFVVPVSMVEEIIELDPEQIITPPAPGAKPGAMKLVKRRGEAVPLLSLAHLFAMPEGAAPSRALIVRRNEEAYAFAVGRMLGQQEIVVRPLEDPLVKVTGIAGATDLGTGKPTLVLDLLALVALAAQKRSLVSA
jgi:two-component system chemotaxis sensor kinase CheA